jgi:uncharacterized protein involved in exopolysaccharide biosynthesis
MIADDTLPTAPQSDPPSANTAGVLPVKAASRAQLRRWAAVLTAPVIVCAAVALLGSLLMRPIYAAEAELVFQPLQVGDVSEQYRSTQIVMVTGPTVLGPVAQTLQAPIEELTRSFSASFPKGGTLMRLRYLDPDVRVAVDRLTAIVDRYTLVLSSVQTIDPATHRLLVPPYALAAAVSPRPVQSLLVGAVTGLALSLGLFAILRRRQLGR